MTEAWMKKLTKQDRLDSVYMEFALSLATLSHCVRNQVGTVITVNNKVVATGYNGSPPGYENCDTHFDEKIEEMIQEYEDANLIPLFYTLDHKRSFVLETDEFKQIHGEWSKREIHAEMNAILQAAKSGTCLNGGTVYVSLAPCIDCAKAVVVSGISRIVYARDYERDSGLGKAFLLENGVKVEKFDAGS
jgi:dCMP deaminase